MEVTKANLAIYLAELAPSATPYPIEITETDASDWNASGTTGTVGNIINNNTPSGVYLDLGLTIIPSSITDMYYTFRDCTALTTAPVIPNSVADMSYTFYDCTALTTSPIIPSSVTVMRYTFRGCTLLKTAPIIPSRVTTMVYTFFGCTLLKTAPIIPSRVTTMVYTFGKCTALTTAPIIPSSVTDMDGTFRDCTALTTAPIIPSSVTVMRYTFRGCTLLHTIQNFAVDVDNCDMTNAFLNCPALANIYVTTSTESSWHLLHTNTGATGTNYTIYNPDGTVAGSGTVAGTSQVLTLYGKSDELVISANITPTLAVETATSQVQWHKSGLPYDDELMIFNAKNPDTVISNFITVNRAGEEFLGRSKDSYPIPTDAVLQYSFDEIKQLPDNPAGTVYKRDNDWTTVDGWEGQAGTVVAIDNMKLRASFSGASSFGASMVRVGTNNGKFIVGKVQSQNAITSIQYYNGTILVNVKIIYITPYEAYFVGKIESTYSHTMIRINNRSNSANIVYFESIYIGDGSYLEPVIDNSYSEAHATNNGVIPVDGVCGKAGYFNNSYMIAPRPALGDDITIYFWVKFDTSTSGSIFCSSRASFAATGLVCYFSGSTQKYALNYGGVSTYFNQSLVSGWHHVTMKCNDTTKVLKINGVLADTVTGTFTNHTNYDTTILFGKDNYVGFTRPFSLDGLKIVPRYTTDDEDIGEYKARANLPKFYAKSDLTSIVTLRRSANFTLPTYLDGQKIRIVNTHATNTITCTLPTGQTMNGQSSFTIAPDTLLEFELIGTAWKCVSNEWELLWTNPGTSLVHGDYTLSGTIAQFKYYFIPFRFAESSTLTNSHIAPTTNLSMLLSMSYNRIYNRACIISGTTFSAGSGMIVTNYAGNGSADDGIIVPLYVYGMK